MKPFLLFAMALIGLAFGVWIGPGFAHEYDPMSPAYCMGGGLLGMFVFTTLARVGIVGQKHSLLLLAMALIGLAFGSCVGVGFAPYEPHDAAAPPYIVCGGVLGMFIFTLFAKQFIVK